MFLISELDVSTNRITGLGTPSAGSDNALCSLLSSDDWDVGDVFHGMDTAPPTGWLLCSGETIGKVGSGADYESADYETLFDNLKAITGVGSESFAGGDTVPLPDLRGRATAGRDDMGGTAASRLTTVGGGVNGATLGASGGTETHTTTSAEMGPHTHDFNKRSTSNVKAYATELNIIAGSVNLNTTATGAGTEHQNTQPSLVCNSIIRYS